MTWHLAPLAERTCPECGTSLAGKRPNAKYCSLSCVGSARQRVRIDGKNSNWRGGKTKHPLYQIYHAMIARCHRPTDKSFAKYGGRGITVCERWREDFWAFVEDIGDRPPGRMQNRPLYSIDRVNNDGNYEPGNVRWATASQQMKNRRETAYAGLQHDEAGKFRARQAS